ncbi:hypothetical protein ABPG74_011758 [Tetrahymena malaccensis]
MKKKYGDRVMGEITVNQALGGMRGIRALFYDQSTVDPIDGVMFRGYSIPELHELLPKLRKPSAEDYQSDQQPLPEGLFFLLLTGELPSYHQVELIRHEWDVRGKVSDELINFIHRLDNKMHPMTMLSLAILYEQKTSKFAQLYNESKLNKSNYWEYTYEDSVDLIAKLPRIAATIYRKKFKDGKSIAHKDGLDWSAQLAHMMGFEGQETLNELLRAFLTIHADHEGGEVSTHASHLVGSALGDPYLCMTTAFTGLAGPLHGLANQEVLKWILNFVEVHGYDVTNRQIEDYVNTTVLSGRLVPGYGHAVLRRPDPRFLHLYDFGNKYLRDNEMIRLLHQMTDVIPRRLRTFKNISSPYPNVDCHSGALLYQLGIQEYQFYTVLFALSRSIGCLTNLVWCRAFGLPIERPESADLAYYNNLFQNKIPKQEKDEQ